MRRFTSPAVRIEASALWQLAWPILIGQLATVGMGVADVAMAGHASAQDLAGVSLGVSIWHIVIITLMGVLLAVNAFVSQHVGAGEFEQIARVVRQALWKAIGVGLLAMLVANGAALVFGQLNVEPKVRALASDFVFVISFALPAFCCYRVLYGYSASLNQTKPMMVIALLALALNIVLNWLLVFGSLGAPQLGGLGCAWATLLCIWFELIAMVWWILRSPAHRQTSPFARFENTGHDGLAVEASPSMGWCSPATAVGRCTRSTCIRHSSVRCSDTSCHAFRCMGCAIRGRPLRCSPVFTLGSCRNAWVIRILQSPCRPTPTYCRPCTTKQPRPSQQPSCRRQERPSCEIWSGQISVRGLRCSGLSA